MPPTPSPPARARRGKAPAKGPPPKPHKAKRIKIPRRATVGDVFALIGQNGLAHLRANEACVRSTRDMEGIHQLRVAVRRMRSAMSLFRGMIRDNERRNIDRRLKWIASQCAEARDWDVFQEELLVPLQMALPADPALEVFVRAVGKIRGAADARVADMLAAPQYAKNVFGIETWWNGGNWRTLATAMATERATTFSRERIGKFHKRVCKLGDKVDELDESGLHDLRIRVKKLRYAVGFLGNLFPSKSVRAYRNALNGIQDCLGGFNDTVIARQLLVAVETRTPGLDPAALERAVDVISGWNAAKRKTGLERLPRSWRRFAGLRPFWK